VRRRILVSIVTLTAVGVVVFAVALGFVLADLYREEEIVRLQRVAAEAADGVPSGFPRSRDAIEIPKSNKTTHIGIYERSGRRVAGIGPPTADHVVRAAFGGEVRDAELTDTLVVAFPLIRAEHVVGIIRSATSLSAVTDRTRDAILVMIVIGVGAIGISALIAIYQSRRLARPVDHLARTAARLGDGDFTVRSERSGISEVDAVSAALETTATRLDQMLSRERTFSEDASHQLRTRITGLRLTLEGARLDPKLDHDATLDAALAEVDRLDRTIDDLLTLAREPPAERPILDVGTFLEGVEDDWHERLAGAGRPLRLTVEQDLPVVAVSHRAARQILDVLLDNSLRHGSGVVTIRARPAPPGVAIEVSDEGPGIDGDARRIFDRRPPGADGHGIGLALARSLAEAEGGRLRLEHASPTPVFALFVPTPRR
jgi:signal transduction histidine kinase